MFMNTLWIVNLLNLQSLLYKISLLDQLMRFLLDISWLLVNRNHDKNSQFFQKLKSLAKDCDFKSVSAEQNENDAIRDAFISVMMSANIRQRLLENKV